MIRKIIKLYPDYIYIFIKNNKLYDQDGNKVELTKAYRKKDYILIDKNSYEVHKKTK